VTTPPSKGLVVELYLIYFGLAQSFVDDVKRSEIVEKKAVKTDGSADTTTG
jgi:hypothetical protein